MPSSFKQNMTVKNSSAKIKWMDTALAYSYVYTESTQVLAEKIAIRELRKPVDCKLGSKYGFEPDAVINFQKKKLSQHKAHYADMIPDLARFGWCNMSLEQMEAKASEIIHKLDSLRLVDTASGSPNHSKEYILHETKLAILLEAQECVYRIKYIDSLLRSSQQFCKGKETTSDKKFDLHTSLRYLIPFRKCVAVNADD